MVIRLTWSRKKSLWDAHKHATSAQAFKSCVAQLLCESREVKDYRWLRQSSAFVLGLEIDNHISTINCARDALWPTTAFFAVYKLMVLWVG